MTKVVLGRYDTSQCNVSIFISSYYLNVVSILYLFSLFHLLVWVLLSCSDAAEYINYPIN